MKFCFHNWNIVRKTLDVRKILALFIFTLIIFPLNVLIGRIYPTIAAVLLLPTIICVIASTTCLILFLTREDNIFDPHPIICRVDAVCLKCKLVKLDVSKDKIALDKKKKEKEGRQAEAKIIFDSRKELWEKTL